MKNNIHAALGANRDFSDNGTPANFTRSGMMSVNPGVPITVEKAAPLTSHDLITQARRCGATVTHHDLRIYSETAFGRPRRFDNQDLILGWKPVYDDVAHLKHVCDAAVPNLDILKDMFKGQDLVSKHEMQDLPKMTVQRTKNVGWFLDLSFVPDLKLTPYPQEFNDIVGVIIRKYKSKALDVLRQGSVGMRLMDFDPPETMTGLPTMSSGGQTHTSRISVLKALAPRKTSEMKQSFVGLARQLGLPDNMLYSSVVSSRFGPINKQQRLWTLDGRGAGFRSVNTTQGLSPRVRQVYPMAHAFNYVVSPMYVAMSTARSRILGLWHTPELMNNYVRVLKGQGKIPLSSDFSAMDKTMGPPFFQLLLKTCIAEQFCADEAQFFLEICDDMGVFYPSFMGTPDASTEVKGVISMLSGIKLTSEFDTIFNLATTLYLLLKYDKDIVRKWESGSFVWLAQGDDGHATFKFDIDPEDYAKRGKDELGVSLKIFEDSLFLKKMLNDNDQIPHITRLLSRFIQQTCWNEDRYDGIVGGQKPDALLRFAMFARFDSLEGHPRLKDAWPFVWKIVEPLGFIQRSSRAYRDSWAKAKPVLETGDHLAVLQYAQQVPNYFAMLVERSKYEPSAMMTLRTLQNLGIDPEAGITPWLEMRRLYDRAYLSTPTGKDVSDLRDLVSF